MSNDRDRLNQALSIYQEFGPRRGIPVKQRWQAAFPDATSDDMDQWHVFFQEIERFAYTLGVKVVYENFDEGVAVQKLSDQFPQLDKQSISRTYSQCCYFAGQ